MPVYKIQIFFSMDGVEHSNERFIAFLLPHSR